MSDLNGIGYPIIIARLVSTGVKVEEIHLDLCGEDGLIEDYAKDFKRVVLDKNSRKIDYGFKGDEIIFTLDYAAYLKADNLELIEKIDSYHDLPETYFLQLIPRSEKRGRKFVVRYLDGKYQQRPIFDGIGHELGIIKFVTEQSVAKNFMRVSVALIPGKHYSGTMIV